MPIMGQSIINGRSVAGRDSVAFARNPASGRQLEPAFSQISLAQLEDATKAAEAAFDKFRATSPEVRADFLERVADNIDAIGSALTERGTAETGLPASRLDSERGRTVGQLRMFAEVVRQGDHLQARIDPSQPDRLPTARVDIRQRHIPLGPVAVFGASNFPLAFSTAGGDTASALAAGCPVVVKAHNAHPGTAEMVGHAVARAVKDCGMPDGVFSLLFGSGNKIGQALVADPRIKAVGFTGSQSGGTALMKTAAARAEPIPVYAEMSSVNPVFILPGSLAVDIESLANGFVSSLTMGAGQFCTNPGLVFVPDSPAGDAFIGAASRLLRSCAGQTMLTPNIAEAWADGVKDLMAAEGVVQISEGIPGTTENAPAPCLFSTTAEHFASSSRMREEVFGAAGLIVRYSDVAELISATESLHGQLTATIQYNLGDEAAARELLPVLERKVGRILLNGWPTGIEVGHSMVHGGPFPATSDSRVTSVGSLAIHRFQRPVSYQNFPDELLPEPLQDNNPWNLNVRVAGTMQSSGQSTSGFNPNERRTHEGH